MRRPLPSPSPPATSTATSASTSPTTTTSLPFPPLLRAPGHVTISAGLHHQHINHLNAGTASPYEQAGSPAIVVLQRNDRVTLRLRIQTPTSFTGLALSVLVVGAQSNSSSSADVFWDLERLDLPPHHHQADGAALYHIATYALDDLKWTSLDEGMATATLHVTVLESNVVILRHELVYERRTRDRLGAEWTSFHFEKLTGEARVTNDTAKNQREYLAHRVYQNCVPAIADGVAQWTDDVAEAVNEAIGDKQFVITMDPVISSCPYTVCVGAKSIEDLLRVEKAL
ncbi:uncharacterized protein ACA1_257930 [Acanthamoeba castellanii str. Neff]|uniref:Uncharacterized protein n=1 Tax=Acanthamoeba castellanii (strain ATCC 30010 / Neff) TaxID=1257118 RepID=L8GEZ5_ACACF|nr:uncharacterized protein ACA1_257930 [Acanthamoeba castellanii str. Neff]ELR11562.1 hypothetical protein ACA1_257930 [Acanthamoeba castellanii str. Neff]